MDNFQFLSTKTKQPIGYFLSLYSSTGKTRVEYSINAHISDREHLSNVTENCMSFPPLRSSPQAFLQMSHEAMTSTLQTCGDPLDTCVSIDIILTGCVSVECSAVVVFQS